jgi:neurofibromin 1
MGFVAGTCFQHNPATQPQAFTVLGCLATEEVDDDLVFQVLVALSSVLNHYTDADATLVVSMLGALSRVGVMENSRYSMCLFWLAVGILQMRHIPLFTTGLDLLSASLETMRAGTSQRGLAEALLESRAGAGEAARRLDQLAGVSFETDVHFSLLAVVWKGVLHPSTRQRTIDVLLLLLRMAGEGQGPRDVGEGVAYFVGLLPVMVGAGEVERLYAAAGLQRVEEDEEVLGRLSIS